MGMVGKPEGKRPLEEIRRSWEDNIKMNLREIGGNYGLNSFGTEQGPLVVMNIRVP
jgi:hypothetical protein